MTFQNQPVSYYSLCSHGCGFYQLFLPIGCAAEIVDWSTMRPV